MQVSAAMLHRFRLIKSFLPIPFYFKGCVFQEFRDRDKRILASPGWFNGLDRQKNALAATQQSQLLLCQQKVLIHSCRWLMWAKPEDHVVGIIHRALITAANRYIFHIELLLSQKRTPSSPLRQDRSSKVGAKIGRPMSRSSWDNRPGDPRQR